MYDKFYRSLYRIRRVEEEIARIYPTDKIKSPVHLSIGQEATAVGVCEALRWNDVVFGNYRNHALYLAKGGDLNKMIAELFGKATGSAKGKGGSMHLIDPAANVLGASAVVGTTIPNAVGYAYAMKLQKRDTVVGTFFGDGAVDEGAFYESLNFAALTKAPVLFICENNGYAVYSRQLDRQPASNITERARTVGVPATRIEDNDVLAIFEHVKKSADAMRAGDAGPHLFECMTYRWREHVGPNEDFDNMRRPRAEAERWFAKDQVKRIGDMLDPATRKKIADEVEAEICAAFEFAEQSLFPAAADLYADVFKET